MSKGKKFTAAEKHFQGIINSRDKMIKRLEKQRDELLLDKQSLMKENQELKIKLEYTMKALDELSDLKRLSPDDIKVLVDNRDKMNNALDMLGMVGNIGLY